MQSYKTLVQFSDPQSGIGAVKEGLAGSYVPFSQYFQTTRMRGEQTFLIVIDI